MHGLSLVVGSRGCSLVVVHRLLMAVASRCREWALGLVGSVVVMTGLVAESFQTRVETHVRCISKRILNHWITGKSYAVFRILD